VPNDRKPAPNWAVAIVHDVGGRKPIERLRLVTSAVSTQCRDGTGLGETAETSASRVISRKGTGLARRVTGSTDNWRAPPVARLLPIV